MNNTQNRTEISHLMLLLVIFTILGAVIGLGIGSGISFLSSMGVFSYWKPLGAASIVDQKILYANSNAVWVETAQGDIYVRQLNCPILNTDCKAWKIEEDRNRFRYVEKPPEGNEGCAVHVSIRPNAPPDNSIQCVYASRVNTLNDGFTYFALTGDHEIWYWRTPNSAQKPTIIIFSVLTGLFISFFFSKDFTTRRKGQYKQALSNLVSLFTSMVLFAIAGSIVGLVAGIGIVYFQETGAFTSWQLLDSPTRFTRIVDTTHASIWAQSIDEKLYVWNSYCPWEKCNAWVETKAVPDDAHSAPNEGISKGDTCRFESGDVVEGNVKPKNQPGNVVECVLVRAGMYESSWTVYYALLDDGTIWYWNHTENLFNFIYIPLISILVGIILGAIAGVVGFIVRKKNKRMSISTSS